MIIPGGFVISSAFSTLIGGYGIASGDWDGDGRVDIVASSTNQVQSMALFRNVGGGKFEGPIWIFGSNVTYVPTIARLDGSNRMFLLAPELETSKVDIYEFDTLAPRVEWPSSET